MYGSLKDKHSRLVSIASPKVILVGGSNLAYGVDSVQLEKSLHMPVVNMGLCTNFGLAFMLEELKGHIGPGDIIVVSPEHELFYDLAYGCRDVFHAIEVYPPSAAWLLASYAEHPSHSFIFLKNLQSYVSAKCHYIYSQLLAGHSALFDTSKGARRYFNEEGDYYGDAASKPIVFDNGDLIPRSSFDPDSVEMLNDFFTYANSNGATLLLSPPVESVNSYVQSQWDISDLYSRLKGHLKAKILTSPQFLALPNDEFFDSPYHLRYEYRSFRTKVLSKNIAHSVQISQR